MPGEGPVNRRKILYPEGGVRPGQYIGMGAPEYVWHRILTVLGEEEHKVQKGDIINRGIFSLY